MDPTSNLWFLEHDGEDTSETDLDAARLLTEDAPDPDAPGADGSDPNGDPPRTRAEIAADPDARIDDEDI